MSNLIENSKLGFRTGNKFRKRGEIPMSGLQLMQYNETAEATKDPVLATLEGILRNEECAPPCSRFAEALRLALEARREFVATAGSVRRAAIAPYRLRRAIQYLDANLCGDVRLEDIASCAGLSPAHFCRQFKRALGVSPRRYVLEKRIQRAMELILNAESSLVEVALAVGFSSQSHFTVTFKKLAGIPPRQYRERYRQ
jgi:AraC-like DNA-binding protein